MNISSFEPIHGPTNPAPGDQYDGNILRFASVIGLVPEKETYYRQLHADAWPSIINRLRSSRIQNYSIFITEIEGKKYLFSYMEYVGDNLEADMRAIAEDPESRRWWHETEPCQIPLPSRHPGSQWSSMEQVFFMR